MDLEAKRETAQVRESLLKSHSPEREFLHCYETLDEWTRQFQHCSDQHPAERDLTQYKLSSPGKTLGGFQIREPVSPVGVSRRPCPAQGEDTITGLLFKPANSTVLQDSVSGHSDLANHLLEKELGRDLGLEEFVSVGVGELT